MSRTIPPFSSPFAASFVAAALLAGRLATPATASIPAPPLVWSNATTADYYPPDVSWAPGGGAYVASTFGVESRASLTRYDSTGAPLWRRERPAATRGDAVATDFQGNVYLIGEINTPPTVRDNVFLAKYDPDGGLLWNTTFGSAIYDWPTGVAVDVAGNAYAVSSPWATNYGVPPAGTHTQARRYNAPGTLGWERKLEPPDGSYPGGGAASWNTAVVSGNGFLYASFTNYFITAPNTTSYRSYLSKISLDGVVQWTKALGDDAYPAALGVDSHDDLYLAAGYDLMKLDADGNLLWEKTNNSWRLFSLAVGPGDRIFVGGDKELEPYLAEYDASGNLQWSLLADQPANEWTTFYGLAVSGQQLIAGALYSSGGFWAGNLLQAYEIIPEPSGAALAAAAILATAPRGRRRTTASR
jgi:hypothetical protein